MMKTIRWGMIGCGSVAEVKSGPGFYTSRNSTLAAVTSRSPDSARSFAARHGVARVYDTSEQLIADPDIDAIYIATPPSSHLMYSAQAANAGKHVYVEKPMAMRLDECHAIVDVCTKNSVRLFVAFYRRAMPRFLKIKAWMDSGLIGDVRCVRALIHQVPDVEERSRDTLPWRVRPEVAGGGKFLDLGVHMFDIFDAWFGRIEEAQGMAINRAGFYDVEDTVTATWRHASGVLGSGSWCFVCGQGQDRVEITGSRGRIEFEFFSDQALRLINGDGVHEANIPNPPHVQQPFIQSIVDDLNGIAPCPGRVESAVNSTWVADQVLKNYRHQNGF